MIWKKAGYGMQIYVSTNQSDPSEWDSLFHILDRFEEYNMGLEILPLCHKEGYFESLDRYRDKLSHIPITFHEPYISVEHSAPKGSLEYQTTIDYCRQMFEYAQKYNSSHVVYHLNNRPVPPEKKSEWLKTAIENLREIKEMAASYQQTLLVENTGVIQHNNMLLDENEFVDFFNGTDLNCLLDIGHAHCNKWNLDAVTKKLADRIRCYHVHNNYQNGDDHNLLGDGSLDPGVFFESYQNHTPDIPIVMEYRTDLLTSSEAVVKDISYVCHNIYP